MMTSVIGPSPHPAVTAYPLDDDLVLYHPDRPQAYVLNRTGARIWELCDGTRNPGAIARAIARGYQLDYRQALGDVQELLQDLRHAGLLAAE
jgi:hypothetical protein